ncbi:E1-like protein-activating enzyme Gsa7p/Apg7p [Kwoniella sp. CBS 6097]
MPVVQFQPLSSQPTPSFWSALTSHKLDNAKLDDSSLSIRGWLEEGRSIASGKSSSAHDQSRQLAGIDGGINVGGNAFGDEIEKPPLNSFPVEGVLKNFNTIEQFRQVESKKFMFDQVVDRILESWDTDSPLINFFLLVTFADLKKYVYQYWFAFPALLSKPAWEIDDAGFGPVDPSEIENIRRLMTSPNRQDLSLQTFLIKSDSKEVSIGPLSSYQDFFSETPADQRTVAFRDPSSSEQHPGWPLRNILSYLQRKHNVTRIRVLCLREGSGSRQGMVWLPGGQIDDDNPRPSAVGWERNHLGKLASRSADIGPTMDPTQLAGQAVDLNLKLMKWRVMPKLDLEKIAQTKCLLLGAGTLGCYAWGIRHITLVDSGKVSFSNPVRQPLFKFEDCLNGGLDKAGCAANRLRQIFPGVNAIGHTLAVPMPGHTCPQLASDLRRLEALIQSHDAIFLLMDSRESRWLPTVIGAAHDKVVINAALGFETYLVMRHGSISSDRSGLRLGCYFCNDVVAPADSMTDRTLDQMCTVTRPGVAPIAAATAVELLVSVLQHPMGGPAFEKCTGCSSLILDKYREEGLDFVKTAVDRPSTLEKVTGLDRLHEESVAALEQFTLSGSDNESGDE